MKPRVPTLGFRISGGWGIFLAKVFCWKISGLWGCGNKKWKKVSKGLARIREICWLRPASPAKGSAGETKQVDPEHGSASWLAFPESRSLTHHGLVKMQSLTLEGLAKWKRKDWIVRCGSRDRDAGKIEDLKRVFNRTCQFSIIYRFNLYTQLYANRFKNECRKAFHRKM